MAEQRKFFREQKALKNKAIRQREKDMKLLWGEVTSTTIQVLKETPNIDSDLDEIVGFR